MHLISVEFVVDSEICSSCYISKDFLYYELASRVVRSTEILSRLKNLKPDP